MVEQSTAELAGEGDDVGGLVNVQFPSPRGEEHYMVLARPCSGGSILLYTIDKYFPDVLKLIWELS
jgi:ATP-dependent helicase YprA (DUF1998 family)